MSNCTEAFRLGSRPFGYTGGPTTGHRSEASEVYQRLEQEYRIALMGLGGRALFLAQSNRIADVNPYLDVGRLSVRPPWADGRRPCVGTRA